MCVGVYEMWCVCHPRKLKLHLLEMSKVHIVVKSVSRCILELMFPNLLSPARSSKEIYMILEPSKKLSTTVYIGDS